MKTHGQFFQSGASISLNDMLSDIVYDVCFVKIKFYNKFNKK